MFQSAYILSGSVFFSFFFGPADSTQWPQTTWILFKSHCISPFTDLNKTDISCLCGEVNQLDLM